MKTTKPQRAEWRTSLNLLSRIELEDHFRDTLDDLGETLEKLKLKERALAEQPKPTADPASGHLDEMRTAMANGDPLGAGRDPELWAVAIDTSYCRYRSATSDPDATLRFSEARDDWLTVLSAFTRYVGISPFMRYYGITDWLLAERKRAALRQDDEADVAACLEDLWKQLFEPESYALELAIESLKTKHAG